MKAMVSMTSSHSSCCAAVAGTSVHNIPLMDTARILAVSICVLCLGMLRIIGLST